MIEFANGGRLLQSMSELPTQFVGASKVYLDFETTSGDPTKDSLNPWHDCGVAGFGLTVDHCQFAIYVDYMRLSQYEKQLAANFLQDVLWYADLWINHNIKYDANVGANWIGLQYPTTLEFVDTIVSAKLIDSDRNGPRGGYGLDVLAKAWLKKDISEYERRLQPYLPKKGKYANKDYGRIPADIIGEYACEDVLINRELDDYINDRMPERCKNVAYTERLLTKELFEMEQTGLTFDPVALKMAQLDGYNRLFQLESELAELVGRTFRPTVNDDCNEVLCGQFGLPILAYTTDSEGEETDNASFDKSALAAYKALPYAPHGIIDRIIEYRKLDHRNNLFLKPWQELAVVTDGLAKLHPQFNQVVRSGRMSCKDPNAQQLDSFMKSLIIPPPGYSLISTDASQIEFRFIVHYIQDAKAIAAYNTDPDTDFHAFVATLCEISRKPAKTINFGTAFGEGLKKMIEQISANPDVVALVKKEVDAMGLPDEESKIKVFTERIKVKAEHIYKTYHATFPGIKTTAKAAEKTCKLEERRLGTANDLNHYYGYITNLSGRDRHLPYAKYRTDFKTKDPWDRAWLAFANINQSSAADLMKERFVHLCREVIRDLPINPICLVHDELVFMAPTELANDPRTKRDIVAVLENPAVKLSVPVRWAIGVSDKNWYDASGVQSSVVKYEKKDATNLDFARSQMFNSASM